MSGRRRRGLLETLLRGGVIGRRIRVKAILLSSARRGPHELRHWAELEIAKGFVPVGVAVLIHLLIRPLPMPLANIVLGGAMAWCGFVLGQAAFAALRLNRRHGAYMEAVGVDTNLQSLLGDRELWRKSAAGMTMREFIAERKRAPGRA